MISRFSAEVATACLTAAFGLVVVVGALEFGIGWSTSGPQPGAFPFYIGLIIIFASAMNIAHPLINRQSAQSVFVSRVQLGRIASFVGPLIAFMVLSVTLGLYVATALYLFGVMWLQGGYRFVTAIAVGICVAVFFYLVLDVGFKVSLLKGPLEAALGLD